MFKPLWEAYWDAFDNLSYYINWPEQVISLFKQATLHSKTGNFQGMVRLRIPRRDKFPKAKLTAAQVRDHLNRYGVRTFLYLHDAQYFYCSVRQSQAKFAAYLYDEAGGALHTPQTRWGDQQGKKYVRR